MKISVTLGFNEVFKKVFLAFLAILLFGSLSATHNRAGEIIYERIQGGKFKITIITFTEINNNNADRDTLELIFGDGTSAKVARTTKQPGYNGFSNIQRNTYVTNHTYSGTGTYLLSVLDPNRNGGVVNIPNSIERKFYIESYLNITLGTSNNSAILTRDPIAFACNKVPFYYNPAAYDPDGDSLHFEMVPCKADFGLDIPDYQFPDASVEFSIDPNNGILTWNTPVTAGEYNVAIRISEYRKVVTANGTKQIKLVGNILRDMQITVYSNCSNQPPDISPVQDYCVEAGDTLDFKVFANDPNGDVVSLNAYGGPMIIPPVAQFSSNYNPSPPTPGATGSFYWETACSHVRKNPFKMTFEAVDDGFPILANYQVSDILVVAPPVRNVEATPASSNIRLTWDEQECSQGIGYRIYRRSGPTGFVPDSCETGVPPELGYTLIHESNDIEETEYLDVNFEQGLIPGVVYCYLIVTYFADDAESYASAEVCTQLEKDVPILTNVDVVTTNSSSGEIYVAWSPPNEHNTDLYPGPYRYRILRTEKRNFDAFVIIDSLEGINDTTYNDINLNTLNEEYTYKIEMLDLNVKENGPPISMGFSVLGSSIFLRSDPKDNELRLYWNELVPWNNYLYTIYKQNTEGTFDSIASTTEPRFVDSNLTNGNEYCYKVVSIGEYSLPSIAKPLFNASQEHCNRPVDLQAPCAPDLDLYVDDCISVAEYLKLNDYRCGEGDSTEIEKVELRWTNPNLECDTTDDVVETRLFYSPTINGNFSLIYEEYINTEPGYQQPDEFTFDHIRSNTRAGCYYVTAIDSFGNVSPTSDTLCSENCLIYELPNVFTPNADGYNDLFIPFPYCYVEEVEMKIYNRWGNLVYETDDPDILWDGMNEFTKEPVPDGVYFYTCLVRQISVEGLKEAELKGNVHVLGSSVSESPSD